MKTSIISLLFATAFLVVIPISPQITSRGVEFKVATAEAQYYGRGRRVGRRVARRTYRRHAYGGYGGAYYGGHYGATPNYGYGCRCY